MNRKETTLHVIGGGRVVAKDRRTLICREGFDYVRLDADRIFVHTKEPRDTDDTKPIDYSLCAYVHPRPLTLTKVVVRDHGTFESSVPGLFSTRQIDVEVRSGSVAHIEVDEPVANASLYQKEEGRIFLRLRRGVARLNVSNADQKDVVVVEGE